MVDQHLITTFISLADFRDSSQSRAADAGPEVTRPATTRMVRHHRKDPAVTSMKQAHASCGSSEHIPPESATFSASECPPFSARQVSEC